MATAMYGNPFITEDRFPGAEPRIKRALGQMRKDSPTILRLKRVTAALGLDGIPAVYKRDCLAHFGIPSLKLAFWITCAFDARKTEEVRQQWKPHGWRVIGLSTRTLARHSDESLAKMLAEALKELRNRK